MQNKLHNMFSMEQRGLNKNTHFFLLNTNISKTNRNLIESVSCGGEIRKEITGGSMNKCNLLFLFVNYMGIIYHKNILMKCSNEEKNINHTYMLRGLYAMLEVKQGSTTYKADTLPPVLPLQPKSLSDGTI